MSPVFYCNSRRKVLYISPIFQGNPAQPRARQVVVQGRKASGQVRTDVPASPKTCGGMIILSRSTGLWRCSAVDLLPASVQECVSPVDQQVSGKSAAAFVSDSPLTGMVASTVSDI